MTKEHLVKDGQTDRLLELLSEPKSEAVTLYKVEIDYFTDDDKIDELRLSSPKVSVVVAHGI